MRSQARAKVGSKKGNPAYRSPSRMRSGEYRKHKEIFGRGANGSSWSIPSSLKRKH